MKRDIRILLLEDSLLDVYLIEQGLKAANLNFDLVPIESERELRRELEATIPDLVISDHGLPSFDGFAALKIVRQKSPDLPFIFISGSNNQGMVAKMYEKGATDYVYKKELNQLDAAVRRALNPIPEISPEHAQKTVAQVPLRMEALPPAETEVGVTLFCPQCLQAHDAFGAPLRALDELRRDAEIEFLNKPCTECSAAFSV